MDIAVYGSEEFVLGFRMAGIKRIFTAKPEEYEQRLIEILTDSSIGVIAISSADLERLSPAVRKKALDSIAPVVVPVGTSEGSDLREKVKRAIGVDLYKK